MKKRIIAVAMACLFCLALLAGCGQGGGSAKDAAISTGGVLLLRVNPEIAVEYGPDGSVTAVTARNEDAQAIIAQCGDLTGRSAKEAVATLVQAIGQAGYFVEELEGEGRRITIEIEAGSRLPYGGFLEDVAASVRDMVNDHRWDAMLNVAGDTDYGPGNDGFTDYNDTDYGPNNDGVTDYNDTDYGPNNDGVTDYNDTDYGPGNDGVTDYNDTDYGPGNDGVTDYNDTDYGPNNDGVTDYDDTDYGPNNDGVTDYDDTDYDPGNNSVTDYDDTDYGDTDYDD